MKFTNETNLRRVGGTPQKCAATQRDLNMLEKWTERSLMQVLHLESNNFHAPELAESKLSGKEL